MFKKKTSNFLKNSVKPQKYPYKLKFLRIFDYYFLNNTLDSIFLNFFRINYRTLFFFFKNSFLLGFFFIYKHIKFWVLPLSTAFVIFYFSLYIRNFTFFKVILEWFLLFNAFYWLISGFVFFTKKYKYNRFTAAISRFWRRSFILFWLIESSLFIVFIYLLLNASQEPVFAFDAIQLTKFRLYSWKFFLYKAFLVVTLIILTQFLLVQLKFNKLFLHNNILAICTFVLTYIVWIEFYQFFYTINWYGEAVWVFDLEDKVWYAESIFKRARIVNHYLTICIIAKFWHIIYIYIFWVFFILRVLEKNKISYTLLSVNLQNFLILYIMNWIFMYPWLKYILRKFLTYNHQSFYEFRNFVFFGFFNDLILFYTSFFNFLFSFKKFNTLFFYSKNAEYGAHSSQKEFISAQVLESFIYI